MSSYLEHVRLFACRLVVCGAALLAVLSAVPLAAQDPAAPAANLAFEVPLNRPLAITIDVTQSGDIEVSSPKLSYADNFEYKVRTVLVDEVTEQTKTRIVGTRRYVSVESTYNDEIIDPAANGCHAQFVRDGDNVEVKLLNDRILTQSALSHMMSMVDTLCLPAKFPKEFKTGELKEVSLPELAAFVVGYPLANVKAVAHVKLESFDPLSTIGTLAGRMEISGETDEFDVTSLLTLTGVINFEVNVSERRLLSAAFSGDYTYKDSKAEKASKGSVKGAGKYSANITTEIGKKAADTAKKSPKFRTRKIHAWRMGVGIKLPSHYSATLREDDKYAWVRTLDSDKGEAFVSIEVLDEAASNPNRTYDKALAYLREQHPNTQMRKSKNPFGGDDGRIYYIPKGDGDSGDTVFLQSEIYIFRGKFLLYKLYGPPKAYHAALPEFEKARASLGILKGGSK